MGQILIIIGGMLFRRRFRVPYPMFEELVKMTRENNWFTEGCDCTGRPSAPLELKVVLRILGRGYCFDGVEELCFISAEVLRIFFYTFCELFAAKYFSIHCSYPKTKEEIQNTSNIYSRMGLPGCIGSTYCVHFQACVSEDTACKAKVDIHNHMLHITPSLKCETGLHLHPRRFHIPHLGTTRHH